MIRILAFSGSMRQAIKILRSQYTVSILEARDWLVRLPSSLPHLEHEWDERRLREELIGVGCKLDDACPACFGHRSKECAGCYAQFTHCTHDLPSNYDGPVCGSMAFYTSCGRNWLDAAAERPPMVGFTQSKEDRQKIVDAVTCLECHESLKNWGLLGGA